MKGLSFITAGKFGYWIRPNFTSPSLTWRNSAGPLKQFRRLIQQNKLRHNAKCVGKTCVNRKARKKLGKLWSVTWTYMHIYLYTYRYTSFINNPIANKTVETSSVLFSQLPTLTTEHNGVNSLQKPFISSEIYSVIQKPLI